MELVGNRAVVKKFNKSKLFYGAVTIVPPLLLTFALIATAILTPALMAMLGIIMLVIIGIIASLILFCVCCQGASNTDMLCCACVGCDGCDGCDGCGDGAEGALFCIIIGAIVLIGVAIIFGVVGGGIAAMFFGAYKILDNHKTHGISMIAQGLSLLTMFAAFIYVAVQPNIAKYIWPNRRESIFHNLDCDELSKQVDWKIGGFLLASVVLLTVVSIISVIVCLYKEEDREAKRRNSSNNKQAIDQFGNLNSCANVAQKQKDSIVDNRIGSDGIVSDVDGSDVDGSDVDGNSVSGDKKPPSYNTIVQNNSQNLKICKQLG